MENTKTVKKDKRDDKDVGKQVLRDVRKMPYITGANLKRVDDLVFPNWPVKSSQMLNFLVMPPSDLNGEDIHSFSKDMSILLGARLNHYKTSKSGRQAYSALAEEAIRLGADLVVFQASCRSFLKRLLGISEQKKLTELMPVSSLRVCGSRWPIEKILLVIRFDTWDEIALNWTLYIAKASGAFVSVLPISVPVLPPYSEIQPDIYTWMGTKSPMGHKFCYIAHRLSEWGIESKFNLRYEQPFDQIRSQVIEENPDLIIIPAESQYWYRRRLFGDLVTPLLDWADRPVLVAKSKKDHKN